MERGPLRIGFLALDEFALMSFASCRAAAGRQSFLPASLYALRYFAFDGKAAISSGGAQIPVRTAERQDRLPTCCLKALSSRRSAAPYLQPATAGGAAATGGLIGIGGISGRALAQLAAYQARQQALHIALLEHAETLVVRWPHLVPERVRFVIDRDRITCGGGIAPLDLMHTIDPQEIMAPPSPRRSATGSCMPMSMIPPIRKGADGRKAQGSAQGSGQGAGEDGNGDRRALVAGGNG